MDSLIGHIALAPDPHPLRFCIHFAANQHLSHIRFKKNPIKSIPKPVILFLPVVLPALIQTIERPSSLPSSHTSSNKIAYWYHLSLVTIPKALNSSSPFLHWGSYKSSSRCHPESNPPFVARSSWPSLFSSAYARSINRLKSTFIGTLANAACPLSHFIPQFGQWAMRDFPPA